MPQKPMSLARFFGRLLKDYNGGPLSDELAVLIDDMPNPFLLTDAAGVCQYVNRNAVLYTGYSSEDLIGKPVLQLGISFYRSQDLTEQDLTYKKKTVRTAPIYDRFGALLSIHREMVPLTGADGESRGTMTIGYPMPSDEEQSMMTMQDAAFLIDSMNCGIIIVDRAGVITTVNESYLTMFGTAREEVIGRSFLELSKGYDSYLTRTLQDGVEYHSVQSNFQGRVFNVNTKLLRSERGVLLGATTMFQDITQMLRLEKMSLIGQMAAGFAHEIRNPMTTVKGFIQVLFESPERAGAYRSLVLEELDRINRLVNDFLLATRPSFPETQRVPVSGVIAEAIEFMKNEAAMRSVELVAELPESLPSVEIDRAQIKQVLLNLIKNAMEALSGGGEVRVRSKSCGGQVRIEVCDNGPGIPEVILTQVGQPFFTTKDTGTGLGLSISRRIVEAHRGTLQIESDAGGTTVTVYLPALP
ncbi:PAS domain-containing protein [Tumebacillus sp. DT12]|uniref:histidine kinase n=1 Tax=Tumebacillus lacus TaxID=2995335 RepID=A0ABT3WVA3_9BACL|nr:PAS domain-containing sensor histidine kinase [Tumebacillus lacus]MCX7568618.1 PAS domain-containing protein [Tumebacillus lacus]